MRVLLAFDKFKDCMSAEAACDAAARGVRSALPSAEVVRRPLADGGEGFARILTHTAGGTLAEVEVTGPAGGRHRATCGFVTVSRIPRAARELAGLTGLPPEAVVAVVEMASASGLALLPPDQRNPWLTSTFGTGELLRHAADQGAAALLLGVGGSATNDLGVGALLALGLRAEGDVGTPPGCPAAWDGLSGLRTSGNPTLPPLLIACDVSNPVHGPRGCTRVYGPQKGLPAADLDRMERHLHNMATRISTACGADPALADAPGSGAAGGIAFGLMTGGGARLVPGFALVSAWLDLDAEIARADWVLTGEGRFDASSLEGKGPGAVVERARNLGRAVDVFAGAVTQGIGQTVRATALSPAGLPLAEALAQGPQFLETAVGKRAREVASGWTDPSAPAQ